MALLRLGLVALGPGGKAGGGGIGRGAASSAGVHPASPPVTPALAAKAGALAPLTPAQRGGGKKTNLAQVLPNGFSQSPRLPPEDLVGTAATAPITPIGHCCHRFTVTLPPTFPS